MVAPLLLSPVMLPSGEAILLSHGYCVVLTSVLSPQRKHTVEQHCCRVGWRHLCRQQPSHQHNQCDTGQPCCGEHHPPGELGHCAWPLATQFGLTFCRAVVCVPAGHWWGRNSMLRHARSGVDRHQLVGQQCEAAVVDGNRCGNGAGRGHVRSTLSAVRCSLCRPCFVSLLRFHAATQATALRRWLGA